MADGEDDGKTEQPSERRLGRAREEGDVPQSQEVKTAAVLVGITTVVWLMAPMVMGRIRSALIPLLDQSYAIRVGNETELMGLISNLLIRIGLIAAIPLLFLLAVGVSAAIAQTGFMISPSKLAPDLNKLNPMTGLGRMFSLRSVVELVKSIVKLVVVGTIIYIVMKPRMSDLESLVSMGIVGILDYVHRTLLHLLIAVVLAVVFIAIIDWFYQRHAFMQKLKMTKQEVKDEHKQTEGDPMIKSRIRSLRIQRARQRMMAAVPKADVVVTNPTHYAVALRYEAETMQAPVLVAKGQNLVAKRIREIAEENEVPIVENPPLARALYATVELDCEIPPEHYKAVAEVISYVMRLKGKILR
jgi:flagellar biosynthetic protein FlhB